MDVKDIIKKLSLEEKIALCSGEDYWHTKQLEKYGIPKIKMSDGPHGLRCQTSEADIFGINESLPATSFPTAVTAGATWDKELYAREGEAIAREAASMGVSVILGPGCNIKRNPLGGRNFEYISEDPYLSGKMAAAFIRGAESVGVSACVKHFAVNNQEYKRLNGDSILDERTLREIYLRPFEIAVKEGRPGSVMCAYNKINGVHASDNKKLLTDILRTEWGFSGTVITDWGAMNDRIQAYAAGCDLNMPGGSPYMESAAADAVRRGELEESCIDQSVERILELVKRGSEVKSCSVDNEAHHALARRIAEEGAVLLKNDDGILPASESDVVLIGYMAKDSRYQGSGSSHINPTKLVSISDAMPNAPCYPVGDRVGNVSEEELAAARDAAISRKIAIVVAGLPENYESEAFDRDHLKMPDGHIRLIEAVAEANPNTVVLLLGGGVMELPWFDRVRGILYMGLSGQAVGEAAASLVFGRAVPSGKLTETWPISYGDVISRHTFGNKNTEYREGVFVGYRYYDKAKKPVRFPFGFGLSYSSFEYSDLQINGRNVNFKLTNTGDFTAAEVVQLYVSPKNSNIFRPERELCGFERIELSPGESKMVEFNLCDRTFSVWLDTWRIPTGSYTVQLGASSRDIRLSADVEISGEEVKTPAHLLDSWYTTLDGAPDREEWVGLMGCPVPEAKETRRGEFTMDSTPFEMRESSLVMKILCKITERVIAKSFDGKRDLTNPAYRMMLTSAVDGPMRTIVISGGGMMSEPVARGLLDMANGRFLRGLLRMLNINKQ